MATKVRKQIYIDAEQDALSGWLKIRGSVEAEIIRQAIDRYAQSLPSPRRDLSAWERQRHADSAFDRSRFHSRRAKLAARICMSSRVFVDTNILVYTCDRSEPEKQRQALQILDQLTLTGAGVISSGAVFVIVTSSRKFSSFMSAAESYEYLQDYISSWEVVNITALIVLEAEERVIINSVLGCQLWATARSKFP